MNYIKIYIIDTAGVGVPAVPTAAAGVLGHRPQFCQLRSTRQRFASGALNVNPFDFLFSVTPFKWLILQSSIHTLKYLQESKVSTVTRAITNNKSGESSWVSKTLASRN